MAGNGPFLIYLGVLVIVVLGGFLGLIESHGHPLFLIPILLGLLYFWIVWEITVGPGEKRPQRPGSDRK